MPPYLFFIILQKCPGPVNSAHRNVCVLFEAVEAFGMRTTFWLIAKDGQMVCLDTNFSKISVSN